MRTPRSPARSRVHVGREAAIVALLCIVATAGLHSVFESWAFLIASVVGAAAALAALAVAQRWRLLNGEMLAISGVVFVVVGIVFVGGAPTPSAVGDFFSALTDAWGDLLTTVVPAELTASRRVAPFTIAWFATTIGAVLIRWTRLPGAPLLGPLAALVVTVLLSDESRGLAIGVGALFGLGALAIIANSVLARRVDADPGAEPIVNHRTSGGAEPGRLLKVALVLVAIGVVAPTVGPRLPILNDRDRYDLRDEVVPPWDPLSVPSPLTELKADLGAETEADVVFEIVSDQPITRWSRATMTSFDGVVWSVADTDSAAQDFAPVGSRLPAPDLQPVSDPVVTATVTVRDLRGPWVPMPGAGRQLSIELPTAVDEGASTSPVVRENVETGTVAVSQGLPAGTVYDVSALSPPVVDDEALIQADIAVVPGDIELNVLPPQIRDLAADIVEGIDHGWGQVAAIRDRFRSEGFYDKSSRTPPGHSYFHMSRFLADPDQLVGYEEQYAAGAALIARIAELPVRVTTGWEIEPSRYVDGRAQVVSGDSTAWIEVRVDGVGWVPVDVSPPRSREPQSDTAVASADQVATPNPPPPPQVPPDVDIINDTSEVEEEIVEEEEDEEEEDDEVASLDSGFSAVRWVAVAGSGTVMLMVLAAAVVLAWKLQRTRRRRSGPAPAARIAGAWLELSDRCIEAGLTPSRQVTPMATALRYSSDGRFAAVPPDELTSLAAHVDRAAYDRVPPTSETAEAAWIHCDTAVDGLRSQHTLPQRTRMRLDPRPLIRRDPVFSAVGLRDSDLATHDDELREPT